MKTITICTLYKPVFVVGIPFFFFCRNYSNTSIYNYSLVQYFILTSTDNLEVKLLG